MASTPVYREPEPLQLHPRAEKAEEEAAFSLLDSRLGLALVAGQISLAVLLFATQAPLLDGPAVLLLLLLALLGVANQQPIRVYGDTIVSASFALTAAIIVIFGVPGAVLAALVDAATLAAGRRQFDFRDLFTVCMFTSVYAAGAAVYGLIADVAPEAFALEMIPAMVFASVVSFCLNGMSLALVTRLYEQKPIGEFWAKHVWLAPHHLMFGLMGLALALAYVALGYGGILAFLGPIFMLRIAIKQYVDKTKENIERLAEQNEQLRTANVEIIRVKDELQASYDGTLEALVNALDARDQETKGHSIRVSRYMLDIAREMGVREGSQEWIDMQRGSLLHDVGKIGVSDTILLKPGKLTEDEWTLMRQHPEIGYNMLRQVQFLEGAAEIILAHHERWDGQGYPRGLHEDEIPLGARIFTVVDTFDSMTSDRPYRRALTTKEALDEILRCSGEQFDPRVVEAFLDIYATWVREREQMMTGRAELLRAA